MFFVHFLVAQMTFCSHLINLSSKREFAQKKTVKASERKMRTLPLSFFIPLVKCYCNDRMRIQDFRPIYTSVFTTMREQVLCRVNQSPKVESYTTPSSSSSQFSRANENPYACSVEQRPALVEFIETQRVNLRPMPALPVEPVDPR